MASRILLADDSITIQKVVNLTFADEGIEVIAVSNGDVAERRLAEIGPDLVLADIFMPGKNGYELCEAIKESSQFRNVPVVLLVGAFEPFDQAEARRVKADAHLTKPFESRTLVETVRRLISASWRSTTGPIAMPAAPESFDESASADSDITQFVSAFEPSALVDGVVQSAPEARNTGELASPSPDVHEVFDLGLGDAPVVPPVSATLTDTSERFEPLEFSPNGDFSPAEVTPSFALDASEGHSTSEGGSHEIQEPHHIIPAQDSLPFENVQPSALHEVNISGAGEGEHWISAGSFETARLDHPSDGAYRGSNGSAVTYPSADFTVQTEVLHGASEAAGETACATLLAVDEPLGDVLFGETAVMGSLAPLEVTNGDALGLELGEPEVAKAEPAMPTHFDLVEIVESAEAEAPAAELTHGETTTTEAPPAELPSVEAAKSEPLAAEGSLAEPAALEASVEETATASEQVATEAEHHHAVEAVEQVPEPQAAVSEDTMEPAGASQPSEPPSVSAEIVSGSDWTTPNAASYSTAQLDPVVMPIDSAEQVAPSSVGEDAHQPESAQEASFTTPATWHEEEAHFTPIDVEPAAAEASSVESGPPPAVSAQPATPDQSGGATAPQSAEGPAGTPAVTALSTAAIEEIVRRVVAEMSESVVREVAWEVVPDCVERVIEQLTRESLSKRA
jgi:CheY-like chemotaxis protein